MKMKNNFKLKKKVSFESFKKNEIHNLHKFNGGGFDTGSGRRDLDNGISFTYHSDYNSWTEGATEWKISYYGANCTC